MLRIENHMELPKNPTPVFKGRLDLTQTPEGGKWLDMETSNQAMHRRRSLHGRYVQSRLPNTHLSLAQKSVQLNRPLSEVSCQLSHV